MNGPMWRATSTPSTNARPTGCTESRYFFFAEGFSMVDLVKVRLGMLLGNPPEIDPPQPIRRALRSKEHHDNGRSDGRRNGCLWPRIALAIPSCPAAIFPRKPGAKNL
jgi:hypothetical protein